MNQNQASETVTGQATTRSAGLRGHVFVVRGLLESVASDALIVPTDSSFTPREAWWPALGINEHVTPPDHGVERVRRFPTQRSASRPTWLMNVAHDGHPSVQWLIDGLETALKQIEVARPHLGDGRVRPLIALPTLGVGLGGYDGVRGEVIKALHEATTAFVDRSDFDIVFVVENAADYAAFQAIRRAQAPITPTVDASRTLARSIRTGDVALLLGAGVSISAGLPTWDALLDNLKGSTLPDLNPAEFAKLGVLDRAQLLAKSSGEKTLGQRVADQTGAATATMPTLAHCLLASLKISKAVTTNYDTLYEDAFRAANGPQSISVLPRQEAVGDRSWLLKMHGDIEDPESIVLSRRDFVLYDARRRPLGSIVQSLMATGHLIVIGASMTDDNVLRLAHEVLAMNATNNQNRVLGTVVTLQPDPLRSALWEGDFEYLAASDSSDLKTAARDLEVLLDGVAMYVSDEAPYILDPRYTELLDPEEAPIAEQLRSVAARIRWLAPDRRDRWGSLDAALAMLGAENSTKTGWTPK